MKMTILGFLSIVLIIAVMVSVIVTPVSVSAKRHESGAEVARKLSDEGIVLLKNENDTLPLKKGASVALMGEGVYLRLYTTEDFKTDEDTLKILNSSTHSTLGVQHGYVPWGAGSSRALGEGGINEKIDPLDAFKAAAENGEITLYEGLSNGVVNALKSSNSTATYKEYVPTEEEYKQAGEAADVAICFIRRWNGECVDSTADYWVLTESEKNMLKNAEKHFDKVVVVLNTPAPIDTSWAKDEIDGIRVDAVIFAGYGGMQGGLPICDVILGRVNPSGKLVTTYAKNLEDYPATESFLNDSSVQKYTEDIFTGYRYFETFDKNYEKVNYEFGFGLSYTTFDISFGELKQDGTKVTASATVKNTGSVAGKEVVQLYLGAPNGALGKAAKALCGFIKTDLLAPGASQSVEITFDLKDFASFDDLGKTGKKDAYVLEAGDYTVYGGNSVRNVKNIGKANVGALTVVEQLTSQTDTKLKERLTANGTLESLDKAGQVVEQTVEKPFTVTVEGEDFLYSSESASGAADVESFAGYLYNKESGEWEDYDGETANNTWRGSELTYEMDIPVDDTYTFSVRASGHGQVKKPAKITVSYSKTEGNYTEIDTVTGTDTWTQKMYNAFEDLDSKVEVKLTKGKYYVVLKVENAPNVDLFTFTSKGSHKQTVKGTLITEEDEKKEEVKIEVAKDPAENKAYKLLDVALGKITMDEFVANMLNDELATFFVANNGAGVGGSSMVTAKYGSYILNPMDGPSGIGSRGTSFPCETIIACTWNVKLVEAFGLVVGKECYDNNVDIWLAPGMNLHRTPIAGRNSEYYSEDPYISGIMASTTSKAAQSMGISVCIKHFVLNEKEKNKLACDSRISERALREIYLKPFEMCVKNASVNGVMSSYNLVNGLPASANYGLLTGILRDEWGFKGYVSGDWNNNKNHIDEINAGNTVREPASYCDINVVTKAIKDGKISRETLESGAKASLYVVMRSKQFYDFYRLSICGDSHEFDEFGRCKKCNCPDFEKHENLSAIVKELMNDNPAKADGGSDGGASFENDLMVAPKKSTSWILYTVIGVLGAAALGVGIPLAIKSKKNKKTEDTDK